MSAAATKRYKKAHPEKIRAEKRLHYTRHREESCARSREVRLRDPRKQKDQRLRRYGITVEQYDAMSGLQNGLCAICWKTPKTFGLCVDHDHKTGKVRGLICMLCNSAIGKMNDSPFQLRMAASYLEDRINGVTLG